MSSKLDPSILAAITEEARQCFLDEDAPEYLQMLEEGIEQGARSDFTFLLRAAHSLKGGAGLASLDSLQELAHKLEDVLIAIQQGQIQEVDFAWSLVERGVNEVASLLSQARTMDNASADPELIEALKALIPSTALEETALETDSPERQDNSFVINALTEDLEASLAAVEKLTEDTPASLIQQCLSGFADECLFLGETLNLPWLVEAAEPLEAALEAASPEETLILAREIIAHLRSQRDAYLSNSLDNESQVTQLEITTGNNNDEFIADALDRDLEESLVAIEELTLETPPDLIRQLLTNFTDECAFLGETLNLPWLVEATAPIEEILNSSPPEEALLYVREIVPQIRERRNLYLEKPQDSEFTSETETETEETTGFLFPQDERVSASFIPKEESAPSASVQAQKTSSSSLRIPLHKLEGMTNSVEELILTQARLSRQQKLLNQANRRLRELTRQFEPIRDRVQNLYDRLAVGSTNMVKKNSFSSPNTNTERFSGNISDNEFDSLELDRYTELHTSLQSFQELMLRVQETRTDLELVDRELVEDLERTQKNLDTLYTNFTESRLVPFKLLAKRFIPQIRSLNQRFDKSVELKIVGENTSIDQVLLEQLQTPLTHLLNNAFDHGIESSAERLANQKTATAEILLEARIENNQLVIIIQDDGCGINLQKVYQRAVERGICPVDKLIDEFSSEEIVDWIFEPDFSTASEISDISGRGMGLDIVRSQIRKLRGNIQVQTQSLQGTTFTLKLPLNLSLMSLLLIQLQNRIVAIPNSSIIEALPYSELNFTDNNQQSVQWQQQTLPVVSISDLLPCPRNPLEINQAKVGIVIEAAFGLLMVMVDALIREEKLIVKPFDDTVPVPPYLAGCTVLGDGEVIPVILPQGFEQASLTASSGTQTPKTITNTVPTILIAEDSVATRRLLEKVLTAVGYRVIVCRDGQEALDGLEQHQGIINLIISDVEMPKVNGFELLQQVRANPIYQHTPVVMATSRTGDRHRQQAMKLGATDYLGKPVQPQELIATVESLLVGS